MNMITIEDAIEVHKYLTNHYANSEDPISPPGIKNKDLLESAIYRPFTSVDGKDAFKTPLDKAAALFHAIIANHCFHNGNKRTSLLLTMCYLDNCGIWLDKCTDEELFEFTRKVAAHEVADDRKDELKSIREFLRKNSRKVQKNEQQLSFSELKKLLDLAGFRISLVESRGEIHSKTTNKLVTKIKIKGCSGTEDYDIAYIKKLRKKLKLTATNGWDSARFYNNGIGLTEKIGTLIKLRGQVLDWLAKI